MGARDCRWFHTYTVSLTTNANFDGLKSGSLQESLRVSIASSIWWKGVLQSCRSQPSVGEVKFETFEKKSLIPQRAV